VMAGGDGERTSHTSLDLLYYLITYA